MEVADAETPQEKPVIPSVSSTDQRSGITAGYVNQLTQNVLPTLVRGPQLEKMKAIFVEGARLKREHDNPGTDDQIDDLVKRSDIWANTTFNWLNNNVSAYAAERFIFRPPGLSYSYNLPGTHAAGYAAKWGGSREGMSELLLNFDQLMRDPSIYPQN